MKSPPAVMDDCDDIFGPPRTYPAGYSPPKTRPSMISAKYRQKEERRKVLKISINKLKKIEDPESSLCRSVLINNTMKRLQREARHEKIQKQQLNYPRCYDNDNILNLKSEFLKNQTVEMTATTDFVESDFDTKLAEEINTAKAFSGLVETTTLSSPPSRKRSFDEMEECDVQEVLSQFYMPPTPRMLTCIDDDEEVEAPSVPKVCKLEGDLEPPQSDFSLNKVSFNNNNNNNEQQPRVNTRYQPSEPDSSFSCGHASMFNELQTNVYHNLIASLET